MTAALDTMYSHYTELIEAYKAIIKDQAQIIKKLNQEMKNK